MNETEFADLGLQIVPVTTRRVVTGFRLHVNQADHCFFSVPSVLRKAMNWKDGTTYVSVAIGKGCFAITEVELQYPDARLIRKGGYIKFPEGFPLFGLKRHDIHPLRHEMFEGHLIGWWPEGLRLQPGKRGKQ